MAIYANHNLENPTFINQADYIDRVICKSGKPLGFFKRIRAAFQQAARNVLNRNPILIHYISDNGNYADAARGEIITRLGDAAGLLKSISGLNSPAFHYHDIPAQDTMAAAFDLAQMARGSIRGGNVFFVNCAPRKKERGTADNQGEKVYGGLLPNGNFVAGTGEDAFIFFRDLVVAGKLKLFEIGVATKGSQFRSRDFFPWVATIVGRELQRTNLNRQLNTNLSVEQQKRILSKIAIVKTDQTLAADRIPAFDDIRVVRRDTHGNLKLNIRHADLVQAFGKDARLVIQHDQQTLEAVLVKGSFDKTTGQTVISAGSSGLWRDAKGDLLPSFAEIFKVGGSSANGLFSDEANFARAAVRGTGVLIEVRPRTPAVLTA